MDLDDLLKEYWPIVAGVVLVLVTAIVLWPSGEEPPREPDPGPVAVAAFTEEARRALERRHNSSPEEDSESDSEPRVDASSKGLSDQSPLEQYQILELVEAVPLEGTKGQARAFKTGDPEVQSALGKVKVTLYEENDCSSCVEARTYLKANGVSVTSLNADGDSNQRERARRLSGSRDFPVIVVDGKVLRGFSETELQAALTSAVKHRVEAQVRTDSAP